MTVMPALRSRPLPALAAALLAAPLAVACSADDPRDDARLLEVAWTSEAEGWHAPDRPWVADEQTWIYRSHESAALVGVGLDDGVVEWTLPMGELCAMSEIDESGA